MTERVARSFARHRQAYEHAAQAQRQIAAKLYAVYRAQAPDHRPLRILEAGYGTGYLTEHLCTLEPAQLWLNDLSPLPLPGLAATYLAGDIARVALPEGMDLVASASMIQWVRQPAQVMARLCGAVAPEGYLVVSGFSPTHFPELQALGSQAGAPSYMTGETMAALLSPGWQVCAAGEWRLPLYFSSALSVMQHLRATGVNGGAGQFRSPRALQDFLSRYESSYQTEQGIPLTYVASWMLARKWA